MNTGISQPNELGAQVVRACLAMGFAMAGVARAEPTSRRESYLEWLAAGRHGEMGYLAEMLEERLDVRALLPGARSVIVVADQYAARGAHEDELVCRESDGPAGIVAKYARGRDYHGVIKRRLHALCDRMRELLPGETFRTFTDTGPAMEREHAVRAGLGFIGKHTLLIQPRLGSYLLLGGVATTVELVHSAPVSGGNGSVENSQSREARGGPAGYPGRDTEDHCGTCTLCIDACPTGAIDPYRVDATKCVSYLTLEHRGAIDPSLHAGIGDRLLGCDVCQDVCPFNRTHGDHARGGAEDRVNPAYSESAGARARLPILDVLSWTEEDRTRVLGSSAGKRASLEMIRRNGVIVAGNALREREDAQVRERIGQIAEDRGESDLMREAAARVVKGER